MVESKPKRTFWVECLRVLAIFFVIYTHVFLNPFTEENINFSAIHVFHKVGVPIFFMISGYTLLGKTEFWHDVLHKRIIRFGAITVIFTLFYVLISLGCGYDISCAFSSIVVGCYPTPTWYMGAYVCFCMLLPILRRMVKILEPRHYLYIYGLAIFAYCLYEILSSVCLVNDMLDEYLEITTKHISRVDIGFSLNTVIYPLLGYYFGRVLDISKIKYSAILKLWLCILAILLLHTLMCVDLHNIGDNQYQDWMFHRVFNIIYAPAVFITFRKCITNDSLRLFQPIIYSVAKCSFGMYLIHMVFIMLLNTMNSSIRNIPAALLVMLESYVVIFCYKALRTLIFKKGLKINNENMKGESVV